MSVFARRFRHCFGDCGSPAANSAANDPQSRRPKRGLWSTAAQCVYVVDSAGALMLGDAQARFLRRAVKGQA
jgi:hypothetical protein